MKILVISNLYPPFYLGGYELGCKKVVEGLKQNGHEVYVLTTFNHAPECEISTNVLRALDLKEFLPVSPARMDCVRQQLFYSRVSNFGNTCAVIDAIMKYFPDVVYVFNVVGIGGLAIIDALNAIGVPWVTHLMDRYPVTLTENVGKSVLEVYHANGGGLYGNGSIISMSQLLVDEIQILGNFKFDSQVKIVPGWVDIGGPILNRSYCKNGQVNFVTAGAIYPHKGIDIIVNAIKNMVLKGVRNFHMDIFGSGDIDRYVKWVKSECLDEFISFKGPRSQEQLINIYTDSDVFLFPTWEREPFGFAPVEASAVGTVPVMTKVCGVAERFIDQVNCVKIDRNADALANVMINFCKNQYDFVRLGMNAQLLTRQDLNFATCLREIENILESCANYGYVRNIMPMWKYINLSFLKHNLSLREFS